MGTGIAFQLARFQEIPHTLSGLKSGWQRIAKVEGGTKMNMVIAIFGQGRDLDPLQMIARTIAVFFAALVLIRISGRRSFGQRSPFDYVIAILLGATLSRAIVGASPVVATLAACLAMVLLHRALGWLSVRSRMVESWLVGVERELYRDGVFNREEMSAALTTESDIMEAARLELNTQDLNDVRYAILERNGQVSLVRK